MKRVVSILLMWCLSALAQAQVSRVEASVNKTTIMVDEAIELSVTAYGDPARDAFDSTVLLEDFVVGRTSTSNRTSIVNGTRSQSTTWTTILFPRSEGTFTIPALDIEGQQTQPITIEALAVPDANADTQPARDYYLTTEVNNDEVYLNQQLHYTLKLYLSTDIERGNLQPPEMKNAQVRQLGEDVREMTIVQGRRYQVITRKFAIVPQRSGEFTIRGPVFTGEVQAPNTNTRFGFFNRTQTINRLGPDIVINVKPKPDDVDYTWLPSEKVELHEEWPEQTRFVVGEPVTRTLTLTASGVVEEMLPELAQSYPPHFKTYPDQTRTATVDQGNALIAQRVESVAVIPTQAGKTILPEVTVPWYNVTTGQTELARIPPRSITVEPAPNSGAASGSTSANNTAPLVANPPAANPVTPPVSAPAIGAASAGAPWWWVWALAAAWLVTLIGLIAVLTLQRRKPGAAAKKPAASSNEAARFKALEQAIMQGSPGQVQAALAAWLHSIGAPAAAVSRPANWLLTAPIQPFVDQMLASVYGHGHTEWHRAALRDAVRQARQQWQQQHSKSALPGLYSPVLSRS